MIELHNWINEKLSHQFAGIREERRVTHTWKRSTGGRQLFAGVTIHVTPSDKFDLEIDSDGVEESFVQGAKNAVFSVLIGQSFSPILKLKVRLCNFDVDEVGSSYVAFYSVTKEAMQEVLGVTENSVENINL